MARPGGELQRSRSARLARQETAQDGRGRGCHAPERDLPPIELAPPGRPEPRAADSPGAVELRACVRAAPAVIAASLRPGGAELALSFGAALSLDVRASIQGLELTLRPASGLERVTRAELPGLVEALRAQGFRVARAEVRPRAPATPRRAR